MQSPQYPFTVLKRLTTPCLQGPERPHAPREGQATSGGPNSQAGASFGAEHLQALKRLGGTAAIAALVCSLLSRLQTIIEVGPIPWPSGQPGLSNTCHIWSDRELCWADSSLCHHLHGPCLPCSHAWSSANNIVPHLHGLLCHTRHAQTAALAVECGPVCRTATLNSCHPVLEGDDMMILVNKIKRRTGRACLTTVAPTLKPSSQNKCRHIAAPSVAKWRDQHPHTAAYHTMQQTDSTPRTRSTVLGSILRYTLGLRIDCLVLPAMHPLPSP